MSTSDEEYKLSILFYNFIFFDNAVQVQQMQFTDISFKCKHIFFLYKHYLFKKTHIDETTSILRPFSNISRNQNVTEEIDPLKPNFLDKKMHCGKVLT